MADALAREFYISECSSFSIRLSAVQAWQQADDGSLSVMVSGHTLRVDRSYAPGFLHDLNQYIERQDQQRSASAVDAKPRVDEFSERHLPGNRPRLIGRLASAMEHRGEGPLLNCGVRIVDLDVIPEGMQLPAGCLVEAAYDQDLLRKNLRHWVLVYAGRAPIPVPVPAQS